MELEPMMSIAADINANPSRTSGVIIGGGAEGQRQSVDTPQETQPPGEAAVSQKVGEAQGPAVLPENAGEDAKPTPSVQELELLSCLVASKLAQKRKSKMRSVFSFRTAIPSRIPARNDGEHAHAENIEISSCRRLLDCFGLPTCFQQIRHRLRMYRRRRHVRALRVRFVAPPALNENQLQRNTSVFVRIKNRLTGFLQLQPRRLRRVAPARGQDQGPGQQHFIIFRYQNQNVPGGVQENLQPALAQDQDTDPVSRVQRSFRRTHILELHNAEISNLHISEGNANADTQEGQVQVHSTSS